MSSSSYTASKQNTSSAPMWAYFGVKVDEEGKATDGGVVIYHVHIYVMQLSKQEEATPAAWFHILGFITH